MSRSGGLGWVVPSLLLVLSAALSAPTPTAEVLRERLPVYGYVTGEYLAGFIYSWE